MAFVFRQSYRGRNLIPKSTKDDDTIGVTLLKEDIKFLLIQLNKAVREDRLLKSSNQTDFNRMVSTTKRI